MFTVDFVKVNTVVETPLSVLLSAKHWQRGYNLNCPFEEVKINQNLVDTLACLSSHLSCSFGEVLYKVEFVMTCDCCFICENSENKEAKKLSRMVEQRLRRDNYDFQKEYKLLILGTGESGKSTFVKQLRIIHGNGFPESEKLALVGSIYYNIFSALNLVVEILTFQGTQLKDKTANLFKQSFRDYDIEKGNITNNLMDTANSLCEDPNVKEIIQNSVKHHLPDSSEYFLSDDNRRRILEENYIPTDEDILRLRVATTGILEFCFVVNSIPFRMVDVGGQRSERRKWIHCFDNVTSIIFLVSLSEYDQTLAEDPDQNRMIESLALFKALISFPSFQDISIILFLNKTDLFLKKIQITSLDVVFKDYTGSSDPDEAKMFILDKFLAQNPFKNKSIYSHFTCATDTENIKFVFNAVKDTVLQLNLKQYNLV